MDLTKKCAPCEGGVKPFSRSEAAKYLKEVNSWKIHDNKLVKRLVFRDFMSLIKFINDMAKLAEKEGHHPDFTVHYNKLDIEIWTHAIGGLSENDFILAAKIDRLYSKFK
ncbi:MAG: 4a-hydroxytetrahydrobiopterin dehydratase [archaeon GW2011_AR5]|nr:MAG: 4a-hydroxytetrahydrobiopterin dehydratase [archaeon GW2011_AR5]MBS3051490.1 4a-hydroxytetrahydrobiopterin dehydratase [Candidatus Aenigmarchaeota archaeon]